MQWTPSPTSPFPAGATQSVTGHWKRATGDAQWDWSVTVTGEPSRAVQRDAFLLLAALTLLQHMPSAGLEESCVALQDIFEYHKRPQFAFLSQGQPPRIKAKLRPATRQSSFRIAEE